MQEKGIRNKELKKERIAKVEVLSKNKRRGITQNRLRAFVVIYSYY